MAPTTPYEERLIRTHIVKRIPIFWLPALLILAIGCSPPTPNSPELTGDGGSATDAGFQLGDPLIRGDDPTPTSATEPGPYDVETYEQDDGLRDGPDYAQATIYYPTDARPPFASVIVIPGYVSAERTIQAWGPFYASHGIVTMTLGTNSLRDSVDRRRDALLDAIVTLRAENDREGSPLEGQLDVERIALSGWSMGGGGAQLAAVADPTLKAIIGLCPWLQGNALDHPVPVLIFGGSSDFIAATDEHGRRHYDNTPETTEKLLFEVEGGGHRVANSPGGGNGDVGRFALSWLKVFLEEDARYRPLLLVEPESASSFETNLD